jgi:hypothetical protein
MSKSTCPKWHFGQVEHGDNWDFFGQCFQLKKVHFFVANYTWIWEVIMFPRECVCRTLIKSQYVRSELNFNIQQHVSHEHMKQHISKLGYIKK